MKTLVFLLFLIISEFSFSQRYYNEVFDSVKVDYDVIYGSSVTQAGVRMDLKVDIFQPVGDTVKQRPLVLLAHGGFFLYGDKNWFWPICEELASHGFVAASMQYRLIDDINGDSVWTPKRAVIDAVYDMKAAVRFFHKDVVEENIYRIDPENIFIGGYSAGAITSLHYAYATTPDDILMMGGIEMIKYIRENNGVEGNSGNPGYSEKVKGVINIAGSLFRALLVDENEPILFSVHGTSDDIVPYEVGLAGGTLVRTEGSVLIHQRAKKVGLKNHLKTLSGKDHAGFWYCEDCFSEMVNFVSDNL